MMKQPIKLYTDSGAFVHEALIPPFETPPRIMIWGERFFIFDSHRDGALEYCEATSFFLSP